MIVWLVATIGYKENWENFAFTHIEFSDGKEIYDLRVFPRKKWAQKYLDSIDNKNLKIVRRELK